MPKKVGKTMIGTCNFRGNVRRFGINNDERRQHTYVIGKTGTGKTTLLENLVLQDIRAGSGICIIDPHGEFVERVLAQIPVERENDIVYFNPVDAEYPIGFNILDVPDPQYKHLVVSDLMGIFTKVWANVWSARMEYILQNCILALLDTPNTTLLGVPRLLVDKDYRQKILANVTDPVVRAFWTHEYETWRDQFRSEAIVPIQNKVGQFLNTAFIRNIVGQPKSRLHIPAIMNQQKIFLVNVSKGKIGEDNSQLLGAMIITKLQLAAMERVRILEDDRKDFYLYVDEFQNFATDSFASILSEARKYRLNLILAHQYVGQLVTDVSTKVRDAVFGNVGTMLSFRVGATDAEFLEKEFAPEFAIEDLINLPNYHIYLKLMVNGVSSRPFSAVTLPPIPREGDPAVVEELISVSRANYARPRAEVEAGMAAWGRGEDADGGSGSSSVRATGEKFETPCANCGKTALVPFRPDGKRPVYCSTCLKKIDDGSLVPLPERMPQTKRAQFDPTLGDLGIEFSGGTKKVVPDHSIKSSRDKNISHTPETKLPSRSSRQLDHKTSIPAPGHKTSFYQSRPKPPASGITSQPIRRNTPNTKPIGLSQLKSKVVSQAHTKRPTKQVDISELRKVLGEAMGDTTASSYPTKKAPIKKQKDQKVVQPGQSVKL